MPVLQAWRPVICARTEHYVLQRIGGIWPGLAPGADEAPHSPVHAPPPIPLTIGDRPQLPILAPRASNESLDHFGLVPSRRFPVDEEKPPAHQNTTKNPPKTTSPKMASREVRRNPQPN